MRVGDNSSQLSGRHPIATISHHTPVHPQQSQEDSPKFSLQGEDSVSAKGVHRGSGTVVG